MRESRTYGSVRGACDETHVPTATAAQVHHATGRRGGVAAGGACAASKANACLLIGSWLARAITRGGARFRGGETGAHHHFYCGSQYSISI
jgi:hypothetical protein